MKNIVEYICESFEENTLYKLDVYFKKNRKELNYFKKILKHFETHGAFQKADIINYMEQYPLVTSRQLISFLDDIVIPNKENIDYHYKFYLIIKHILSHKEEFSKYLK